MTLTPRPLIQFGPDDATEAHGHGHIEDSDGDDDLDLVLHLSTQETGIQCGDTEASLTGETFGGISTSRLLLGIKSQRLLDVCWRILAICRAAFSQPPRFYAAYSIS